MRITGLLGSFLHRVNSSKKRRKANMESRQGYFPEGVPRLGDHFQVGFRDSSTSTNRKPTTRPFQPRFLRPSLVF